MLTGLMNQHSQPQLDRSLGLALHGTTINSQYRLAGLKNLKFGGIGELSWGLPQ